MAEKSDIVVRWDVEDIVFGALLSIWAAFVIKEPAIPLDLQCYCLKTGLFISILGLFSSIMRRCLERGLNIEYGGVLILTPTAFFALDHFFHCKPEITDSCIFVFFMIIIFWLIFTLVRIKERTKSDRGKIKKARRR